MREAGFRNGEAGVPTNLGNTLRRMGRTAEAIACQEQSLATCQAVPDQTGEAIALANLDDLYRDAGRLRQSLDAQEQALAMFRKWGERRWEGSVLDGLARTYLASGAVEQALVHCHEALECRRAGGDRAGEAETFDTLARIHVRRGDLALARSALTRALSVAEVLDTPLAADLRLRLARLAPAASDAPDATPLLRTAVDQPWVRSAEAAAEGPSEKGA